MGATVKQYDYGYDLVADFAGAAGVVPIDTATEVLMVVRSMGFKQILLEATMTPDEAIEGRATYTVQEGDLDVPGVFHVEYRVTWADRVRRFPSAGWDSLTVRRAVAPPAV